MFLVLINERVNCHERQLIVTRTIGVIIYCYEINFIVTSKSRALMIQLIVMDQLWHRVRRGGAEPNNLWSKLNMFYS